MLGRTKSQHVANGLRSKGYEDRRQRRESCWNEKRNLVQWMATRNVVTKESLDMQRMGYSLRVAKTDGDAKGSVGVADGLRSEGYEN